MNQVCLICNSSTPTKFAVNIFNEIVTVADGLLSNFLTSLLGKPISEGAHSDIICRKCYKDCNEYSNISVRLQAIKEDLLKKFKSSLLTNKINYDTFGEATQTVAKRLVLPASKLQPLPADYILNFNNSALSQIVKNSQLSPTINKKPDINLSDIFIKDSKSKENIDNVEAYSTIDKESMVFNLNTLPKDFMTTPEKDLVKQELQKDDEGVSMDIDEECSQVHVTEVPLSNNAVKEDEIGETNEKQYDLNVASDDEDGDAQNDDEFSHTIVVSGDDASILQMMSRGRRVVLDDGRLLLLAGDHDADGDNSDSQLEFQMSGDEDTAHAILKAAQEQGSAFIKVCDSGEMFQVKMVNEESLDTEDQQVIYENGVYKCMICANGIEGPAKVLEYHMKKVHDTRVYMCSTCHKVLYKPSDYSQHIVAEHGKQVDRDRYKLNECTVCHKKYTSRKLLQEHMNMHTGQRPHECSMCGKKFASKYSLHAHHKIHLGRTRSYKCSQCPKAFFTQHILSQHEKRHSAEKKFICDICNKAFATTHNLQLHSIVHSGARPHQCAHCEKAFARRAELVDHVRTHTGERPFVCDVCGARFAQRSNMYCHRRLTHNNDRRHACEHCDKRFKRRRLLEYHMKACHTGERPLQCPTCLATFVYPEHYKKHLRIHSGEKPFVCEVCGKSFTTRDNRNTHRFVHSDKKPFECLVCGAGFMRKQLLYAHMNTSGHLAESIVVNQPRMETIETENLDNLFEKNKETIVLDDIEEEPTKEIDEDVPEIVDDSIIQTVAVDSPSDDELISSSGEMKLVQIQLENGTMGWMAIK